MFRSVYPRVQVPSIQTYRNYDGIKRSDTLNTTHNFGYAVIPRDLSVPTDDNLDNQMQFPDVKQLSHAKIVPKSPVPELDDSGQAALSDIGSQTQMPGIRMEQLQMFDIRPSDDDSNDMTSISAIEPGGQLSINVDYDRSALDITSRTPGVPLYRSIAIPPGFVLPMYRNFVNNVDPNTVPNNLTSHSAQGADAAEVTSPANSCPPDVVVPQNATDQVMVPEHRSSVNSSSVVKSSSETEAAPASLLLIDVEVPQTDQIPTSPRNPAFHITPAQLAYDQVPTETSAVRNEGMPVQMLSYSNMRTSMDSFSTQTTAFTDVPETIYSEGNIPFHTYPSFRSINPYCGRQLTREGEVLVCASMPGTVSRVQECNVNSSQITQSASNAVTPQQSSQAVINIAEAGSSQEPTLMYLGHGPSNVDYHYDTRSMTSAERAPRDSNEIRNFMLSQTGLYNSLSSMNCISRCPTDARLVPGSLYPARNLVMSQESSVAIYPNLNNTRTGRSSSECLRYPLNQLASDDDLDPDNNRLTRNYSMSDSMSFPMYHPPYISQTGELTLGGISLSAPGPGQRNLNDMDSPYSMQSITDVETNPESFHFVPEPSPSSSYHYQSMTDMDSPYSVQSSDFEAQGKSVYPVNSVVGAQNLAMPMYQVPSYGVSVTPEPMYALGHAAVPQPIAVTGYGLENVSSSFGAQSLGEAEATPDDALSVRYALPEPIPIPLFQNVVRMSHGRSYSDGFYMPHSPQLHRDSEPINNLTHDFRDAAEAHASSVPIEFSLGNIAQARFMSETNDPRNQTQSMGDVMLQRAVPVPLYLSTPQQIYFPASTHPINSLLIPSVPTVYHSLTNLGLENSLENATNYPNVTGLVPIYYNMHNIPGGPLIPQVRFNSVQNSVQSIQATRDAAARSEHGYYHPVFRS